MKSDPYPARRWMLEQALLQFDTATWSLRSSFDGTLVLGGIGGGKSSSSVMAWDAAMFEAGAGGLVPVVKAGEADIIGERAAACGRENDLVIFSPENDYCFNPFDWMLQQNLSVSTIVHFCETVMEVVTGPVKDADAFFKPQEQGLLESGLTVVRHSGQVVTPALLASFYAALPKTPEEAQSGEYENTIVGDCVRRARLATQGTIEEQTVEAAIDFFLREYPQQPDKTRACVEMSLTGLLRPFSLSPVLRKLFCGRTNIDPNDTEHGKIIVIDLPINRDRQVGRLANAIWKTAFQMAVERRDECLGDALRPVFLRLEEGQELFTTTDSAFQAKCRSSRCATLFITQNLPGMYARARGDKHAVDSFFGNLSTHIYHSNSDVETCEFMSRNLGKSRRFRISGGDSRKPWLEQLIGRSGKKDEINISSDHLPNVYPDEFRRLKRGGPPDFEVIAYVLLMGNTFPNGRHYALVSFSQMLGDHGGQSDPVSESPRQMLALPGKFWPAFSPSRRGAGRLLMRCRKLHLTLWSWMGFGPNAGR